jgi:predicted permease
VTIDRLRAIVRLRLRSLLQRNAVERELEEELQDHLARAVEVRVARGQSPAAARTEALRAIGGLEGRREECRDARGVTSLEHLMRDVRLAIRQMRRQPALALAAVVSLALGIGANTAMFHLLRALSLRPLPVASPGELVEIRLTGDGRAGRHSGRNEQWSLPQYRALEASQQGFSSLLAFGDTRFNVSPQGEVRYVEGLWVSGSFFETLGVKPAVGRLITTDDDRPGCGFSAAVISHHYWQHAFGGRSDIVGQTIPLGTARVPIVGVTEPAFFGVEVGRRFAVAMPLCSSGHDRRDHWWLAAMGRLRPGWTRRQAEAQLHGILPALLRETMPDYRPDAAGPYLATGLEIVDASTGVSPMRGVYEQPLWILQAIAGLVLLIASANLASLMLARATARRHEFRVRLAMGGPRRRLVQQVLVECALLSVMGGSAAIAVAAAAARVIPAVLSTGTDPIFLDVRIDWAVAVFAAVVTGCALVIFGIGPAVHAARATTLEASPRGAGRDRQVLRRALVTAQLAVTLALLFGSLLFVRSFRNLSSEDTGVRTRGLVVANLFFRDARYPAASRPAQYAAIADRIAALPGVTGVAEAFTTPFGGSVWGNGIAVDGESLGDAHINQVSSNYFDLLGTPLLAGRGFDDRDLPGTTCVALVSRSFADHFFRGDAVGRRIGLLHSGSEPPREVEIVGIVADQKYRDPRERSPRIVFLASSQNPAPGLTQRFVIRSDADPASTVAMIGSALRDLDPEIAARYAVIDTQFDETMLQERLMARLSSLFGVVAIALAAVGLYGVVSYAVASRRAEIGIRVALGAGRRRILGMVLRDVGMMLLAGIAAGTAMALLAARSVGSLLYGLTPADTATLATAIAALTGVALASALWPARRAATVDPLTALREA